MVNDAVHTDQFHTSVAKVLHQLFGMNRAKVGLLKHFILPLRVVQSNKILGKSLWLEWLLDGGSANRTNCQSLLLYFYKALLTECVTAVQVSGDSVVSVEVLVARGAVHLKLK